MHLNELKEKPVWQMTGQELLNLLKEITVNESPYSSTNLSKDTLSKRYVYGIRGIAELFGCSISTANKIKKEGKIKKAILQYGRKIIVDAELALELFSKK
ncbi:MULTISPECIES: DUF3853 family protein [Myroides]|uniref:DUF3853 family protein n=1 Tax=Myroides odoratimimus CCUG 10230 TaxID=883150 RepID=A0ABN0E8A3_9FLAO|nr:MULTISPECIES: DUF3853 family protein [Myroides]EHO07746.1 hypothetical protein HMPREF9712_02482 [Myroides odoratimimus CCUG 10230]MDM1373653.1 DUF3853 family protein [Myroides marinus]